MILELSITIRGVQALVQLHDIQVPDGDHLTFVYRVFITDPEDESEFELTQLEPAEHDAVWSAVNQELQELCK